VLTIEGLAAPMPVAVAFCAVMSFLPELRWMEVLDGSSWIYAGMPFMALAPAAMAFTMLW